MSQTADPFFEAYDRRDIAYGDLPSAPLQAYLEQVDGGGSAMDLGAGAGRDSVALAQAGYAVTSIDLSDRGLARIRERAKAAGVADWVTTMVSDVRKVAMPTGSLDALVATTVLDHIPMSDAHQLWKRMCESLAPRGVLYAEVHTTEDPGCPQAPDFRKQQPVSETASEVINYFMPNQLAAWAVDPKSGLRVLRYEERLEWDYTHGPEHLHGKAILLAVKAEAFPEWYGQPAAFPRRNSH